MVSFVINLQLQHIEALWSILQTQLRQEIAYVAGRRKGGMKVKVSEEGRREGLQGRYCFCCFFRLPDKRKNPDWSDLMNYLVHPAF